MKMQALRICLLPILLLTSCRHFRKGQVMPGRVENYSFAGPGSSKVKRGQFPAIVFPEDSAFLTQAERAKLKPVIAFMKAAPQTHMLIVGFARDAGTEEYNRVLGEQRAQTVREALLDGGCSEKCLQTLSFGMQEPFGGNGEPRRVELAVVKEG